jgi:hypothetical protein
MHIPNISKNTVQIATGTISLIALLAYTFVHTGGLLAHYIAPVTVGYIAAFGIELAVVSLSLRIGDMRRANKPSGFFLFVLISVVSISAMANIAEGFRTWRGEPLTTNNIGQLDVVQGVVGASATGLISLVVLAMSEVVGTDIQAAVRRAERERIKAERESETPIGVIETAETPIGATETPRKLPASILRVVEAVYSQQGDAPFSRQEFEEMAGVAKATASSYLQAARRAGVVSQVDAGRIPRYRVRLQPNGGGSTE